MQYAEVAVDSSAPQKTFTYSIPPNMEVGRGQAVWVPFGRGSQLAQGIVFGFSDTTTLPEVKALHAPIEAQPVLSQARCDLAQWLSDYYFAPLFSCAELMMPPGFRQRVLVAYQALDPRALNDDTLPPKTARVLEYLAREAAQVSAQDLQRALGANATQTADSLVSKGLVARISQLERPRAGPKFQRSLKLTGKGADARLDEPDWNRKAKQRAIVELLRGQQEGMSVAEVQESLGPSSGSLGSLVAQGYVTIEQERVTRDPLADRSSQEAFPLPLTPAQEAALRPLVQSLERVPASPDSDAPPVFLLYGVTGSGKTELYIRALETCVAQGKRGIVLVPEISLEPQMVERFSARFPGKVAVLHSGLSAGEAYDEWWRIREGEFQVVIGPRSALFAPQPDVGLIVMDEEHEPTYKQQDPAPRYHTRTTAIELARHTGAVVLLGSATPSLESYLEALEGRYKLLELPERISPVQHLASDLPRDRGLPQVEVVDLRDELKSHNYSLFSRTLQDALGQAMRSEQQAILFLNRRGSATFVQCRDCGTVVRCRRCEVPLTYHSAKEHLICHHCNLQRPVPTRCEECQSGRIKFLGAGTERVQQEVEALFPQARVLRWDSDTVRGRRTHQEILQQFSSGEADVLVGTQMIAKGLDLPRVTVVGVVNADVNLYLPDYRAAERTFQLLTQVAGRAGRGQWAGKVVIQTYTPDHYAINSAARQDYEIFAHRELAFRRRHGYPPFRLMVRLLYSEPNAGRAQRAAASYARALNQARAEAGLTDAEVLGPVPAFFRRVRGQYRWQVLLKGYDSSELLVRFPPPRGWIIDVDPAQVL